METEQPPGNLGRKRDSWYASSVRLVPVRVVHLGKVVRRKLPRFELSLWFGRVRSGASGKICALLHF